MKVDVVVAFVVFVVVVVVLRFFLPPLRLRLLSDDGRLVLLDWYSLPPRPFELSYLLFFMLSRLIMAPPAAPEMGADRCAPGFVTGVTPPTLTD